MMLVGRERLRRDLVCWAKLTAAPFFVPAGVFSVVAGWRSGEWVLVVIGVVLLATLPWPVLYGAEIDGDRLMFGSRVRRQTVHLRDIAEVRIGRAPGFGFRGSDGVALLVFRPDNPPLAVPESRFCRESTLARWQASIDAARSARRG